jgi:hypothetical protein
LEKELPLIGIVLASFIWLLFEQKSADTLELQGEVDKWGDKYSLIAPIIFIACFNLCINASDSKIDPKKSNRWEEVLSIEIYIGFVHVDIIVIICIYR